MKLYTISFITIPDDIREKDYLNWVFYLFQQNGLNGIPIPFSNMLLGELIEGLVNYRLINYYCRPIVKSPSCDLIEMIYSDLNQDYTLMNYIDFIANKIYKHFINIIDPLEIRIFVNGWQLLPIIKMDR